MRFFVLYLVEGDIGYRCLKKKILMGAKFCWPISYNVNSHFGHGLPEGDTRQPTSHRCNDRAEDVIQVSLVYISFIFFFFLLSLVFVFPANLVIRNGPMSILFILFILDFS